MDETISTLLNVVLTPRAVGEKLAQKGSVERARIVGRSSADQAATKAATTCAGVASTAGNGDIGPTGASPPPAQPRATMMHASGIIARIPR